MMSIFDQKWFSKIKRPSRYLGGEVNCVVKDPAQIELSIVLARFAGCKKPSQD